MTTESALADTFLRALVEKDLQTLERLIHPELYFHTPWLELFSAEDFLRATRRLLERSKQICPRGRFISDTRVIACYDLFFERRITLVRVANVFTFGEKKIKEIEQFYEVQPRENLWAMRGDTFKEIELFYEARNDPGSHPEPGSAPGDGHPQPSGLGTSPSCDALSTRPSRSACHSGSQVALKINVLVEPPRSLYL